ncbi:heme exporter protein CcmB [Aliikangiella coralliicola]|uniref:Heme exporter protein B n=2 Tax=Aliikangiella coralliicola TaxID=2592383 RepID=A0A545UBB2_9GAMM|nr:heme exporter protein CcmB [Aliikangiella coralliicola]
MQLLKRELLRHWRCRQDLINPLIFFVITVSLFPLALEPQGQLLARIGNGIIWVAALLAAMLSLESMYRDDYLDGTLELLLLQSGSPYQVVFAKIISHWLTSGLPLVLMSPLLAVMMQMESESAIALILTLLIGTPVLSLIGSVGMGLTVGLRQGGVLLSLLVLPLYIPILIFGAGAVSRASMGMDYSGQLALMGAFLVGSLSLVPFASVAAIKVSIR